VSQFVIANLERQILEKADRRSSGFQIGLSLPPIDLAVIRHLILIRLAQLDYRR